MDHDLPLEPIAGDVVILERALFPGYEIAVCPEAARIGCESYDEAWTRGRALAEQSDVDFWYARQLATLARGGADGLRLLGHFRVGDE